MRSECISISGLLSLKFSSLFQKKGITTAYLTKKQVQENPRLVPFTHLEQISGKGYGGSLV